MRILFISFYYPPDLSAGSFRAKALVDALISEGGTGLEIDMITTRPNRYQSHVTETSAFEKHQGLRIQRVPLPPHKSGIADQARAFSTFAREVIRRTKDQTWDIVLATSSRLMTAVLATYIAKRIGRPLYLDVRDLFTDTLSDLISGQALSVSLPLFRRLEKYALTSAHRVNLVSDGFLPHAKRVAPHQTYRGFTNGIDDEFMRLDFGKKDGVRDALPLIVYAGNIGDGQGLHAIVPKAGRLLAEKARIRLIGDGGRRIALESAVAKASLNNVQILDPVPRSQLFEHYRDADILFLHLNDHAAFHKVLPSKLFEYAATGKAILAGVAGYPAEFLRTHLPGVEVFAPCDPVGMADAVSRLLSKSNVSDRRAFCERFARTTIMRAMARDILSVAV